MNTSEDLILRVEDLHKRFGEHDVLRGVSLTLGRGETKVVMGSSGTGKSTLLRCINHLSPPDQGRVLLDGTVLTNRNINAMRRQIGTCQRL
ncbi:ATP-binding cassette domain-containing protein [uncultured Rhodospira sp.]|uniref:ATP-binding cassette domain-containing protein n=1 Tax=uncultured Rhodospira sp. TaxID=1936189 RepID=UPI00260D812A|nr:ATP-binding cassette domain-containing protein [uncultured Rhodospira sp.]